MKLNKSNKSLFILGMILTIISSFGTASVFGQTASEEECAAYYQKFVDNRQGPGVEKFRTAVAAGKEFLKCYSPDLKEQADYIKAVLPGIEAKLPKMPQIIDPYPGVGKWYSVDKQYGNPENGTVYKLSNWRLFNYLEPGENNKVTGGSEIVAIILTGQPRDIDAQSYRVHWSGAVFKIRCAEKTFNEFSYIEYSEEGKPTITPHYAAGWQSFDRYKNSRISDAYKDACKLAGDFVKQQEKEIKKAMKGIN